MVSSVLIAVMEWLLKFSGLVSFDSSDGMTALAKHR